jgi:flagellar hook assembly protein FlgD
MPNPFNPRTTFRYSLPADARVRFSILDVRGRRVATLVERFQAAGPHELQWSGIDRRGNALPSGVYLARLEAGGDVATRKLTLLR